MSRQSIGSRVKLRIRQAASLTTHGCRRRSLCDLRFESRVQCLTLVQALRVFVAKNMFSGRDNQQLLTFRFGQKWKVDDSDPWGVSNSLQQASQVSQHASDCRFVHPTAI